MKTTSKAIVWVIIVFVTGVVFGGALTFLIYQPHNPPWADHGTSGRKSPDRLVDSISEKLKLDEEQKAQFRAVLVGARDQFRAARGEIQRDTRERIKSILSPDQLEQFDKLMANAPRHHPLGRQNKSE